MDKSMDLKDLDINTMRILTRKSNLGCNIKWFKNNNQEILSPLQESIGLHKIRDIQNTNHIMVDRI